MKGFMMNVKAGELWIAEITFTDGSASKKRPVLILWTDGDDVVVAAVTSSKPRTQTDVVLVDWESCGLRVASTVRLSRLDCLEPSLLIRKLGELSSSDAKMLTEVWTQHVKPNF
jgi:mRNA interferase MazF